MDDYDAGTFKDAANTELGIQLWRTVNEPKLIAAMETASQLGRPAVEGIGNQLLERFREKLLDHRTKQMLGHMVKQILESRGWVIHQTDVKVHSVPFIKAASYRRKDAITLYAYRSADDQRDVAVIAKRDPSLAPKDCRWVFYATLDTKLKAAVFGLPNVDLVLRDIETRGFHRTRIERMLRPGNRRLSDRH